MGANLEEWMSFEFMGGPFDGSAYMVSEKAFSENHIYVAEKDGQFYKYEYDDVMNAMIYVEQVYMNEEGVIEYGC